MRKQLTRLAVAVLCAAGASRASGAVALDFGATGQRVEPGFREVSGTGTGNITNSFAVPAAALPDGETVTISSSILLAFRDRGNFSNANHGGFEELVEDYIRAGTGDTNAASPYPTLTIDVGNLLPSTPYDVTLRLYDGSMGSPGPYTFTITGTNDANAANNTYAAEFDNGGTGATTAAERAGHVERFTSTAAGTLQITIAQLTGGERIIPVNSLQVVAAPEPTAAGLLTAAAAAALLRRRSRSV